MKKELLTIEFRYHDAPKFEHDSPYRSKTVTVGVFETLEDAVAAGNTLLKELAKTFEVRPNDVFKVNGLFGAPERLVTNTCYRTKGTEYFAKITRLDFSSVTDTVTECFTAYDRYKSYKKSLDQ